jgi:hypothetical protein
MFRPVAEKMGNIELANIIQSLATEAADAL